MNDCNIKERVNAKTYEAMLPYKMALVNSADIDTATYQRKLDHDKVKCIAATFNERIANEPKVSFRDGKYFVFDGHHTIEARKKLNHGLDLEIVCKVFYDMTQEEEARLFAAQTGISSKPTSGVTLRAKSIAKDTETLAFIKANKDFDVQPSFSDVRGKYRLRCINTAQKEFHKIGERRYREAMKIIVGAWKGKVASFMSEVVITVCEFVNIYMGEYEHNKLVKKLSYIDPYDMVRVARSVGEDGGKTGALRFILHVYNCENMTDALPVRF